MARPYKSTLILLYSILYILLIRQDAFLTPYPSPNHNNNDPASEFLSTSWPIQTSNSNKPLRTRNSNPKTLPSTCTTTLSCLAPHPCTSRPPKSAPSPKTNHIANLHIAHLLLSRTKGTKQTLTLDVQALRSARRDLTRDVHEDRFLSTDAATRRDVLAANLAVDGTFRFLLDAEESGDGGRWVREFGEWAEWAVCVEWEGEKEGMSGYVGRLECGVEGGDGGLFGWGGFGLFGGRKEGKEEEAEKGGGEKEGKKSLCVGKQTDMEKKATRKSRKREKMMFQDAAGKKIEIVVGRTMFEYPALDHLACEYKAQKMRRVMEQVWRIPRKWITCGMASIEFLEFVALVEVFDCVVLVAAGCSCLVLARRILGGLFGMIATFARYLRQRKRRETVGRRESKHRRMSAERRESEQRRLSAERRASENRRVSEYRDSGHGGGDGLRRRSNHRESGLA